MSANIQQAKLFILEKQPKGGKGCHKTTMKCEKRKEKQMQQEALMGQL